MQIQIIAVGHKMPAWVAAGFDDFCKRLPRHIDVDLVNLAPAKSAPGKGKKSEGSQRIIVEEGEKIMQKLNAADHVIALDVKGKMLSSEMWAEALQQWQMSGKSIKILIGGANGLGAQCLQRADKTWSLSPMTLPHQLVKLVLIEQIYRAHTMNIGHPYHRC